MAPRGLSHVELTVQDMERSLHFYRDLLGFTVLQPPMQMEGGNPYQGIFERSDRKFSIAVLCYGKKNAGPYGMSEDAPVVALVSPIDPPPSGTSIKVDQVGITHVGFWVKGVEALYDELKSKGVKCVVPPYTGAKTEAGKIRSIFVEDPDGILIQLDEMVPRSREAVARA
jgi:glyoxylase I family protein